MTKTPDFAWLAAAKKGPEIRPILPAREEKGLQELGLTKAQDLAVAHLIYQLAHELEVVRGDWEACASSLGEVRRELEEFRDTQGDADLYDYGEDT